MAPLLWLAHILLALAFIIDGVPQALFGYTSLVEANTWMSHSPLFIKLKGWLEILSAFGVIIPPQVSLYPSINVIAAMGILLMLLGLMSTLILTGNDGPSWTLMVTLAMLATFISCTHLREQYAWGRIN